MPSRYREIRTALFVVGVCAAGCSSSKTGTQTPPVVIKKSSADWNMLGYDVGSTYWNQGETKLTKKNVGNLEKAWEFDESTPRVPIEGWLQGAVQDVGRGRAAFFGEAAMFSAQLAGPDRQPMGMNAPDAPHNFQFVLNVMHWPTRKL